MSLRTPRQFKDITPEWLTAAFRRSQTYRTGQVTEIEIEPLGSQGVGFLSGLARLQLTYDEPEAGAPASVVAKLPAVTEANRNLGDSYRAYEREYRFYYEVAPHSRIRAPRCYYCDFDAEEGNFILIMEDLSKLRAGDQVRGLTMEEALAALRTIAPFHAQWWEHSSLEDLAWMPLENLDLQYHFAKNWPAFRHEMYDRLMPDEIAVGDRLNWQGDRLANLVRTVPRTIVHWDYRADNLIFDRLDGPDPVVVLDWQFAQRSMGAFDIARLFCGSVPGEIQRSRHRSFVGAWHDALRSQGVTDYPIESAWRHFLIGVLVCLYIPVSFYRIGMAAGDRGCALVNAMIFRYFRAAVETDACQVLDT
jgi:hypothetical protein